MNLVLTSLVIGLFSLPLVISPAQADAHKVIAIEKYIAPAVVSAKTPAVPNTGTAKTVTKKPAAAQPATPQPAAAKPAAVTTPAPATDSSFAQQVEQEILKLVNAQRAKQGLGTLKADSKLASIARAHSADMLAKDYFSHTNKSGCDSVCRVTKAGYAWSYVGENIYTMYGYNLSAQETARRMMDGWMNSAGHKANILKSAFSNHGVGIAVSGSTVYATSLFATPK